MTEQKTVEELQAMVLELKTKNDEATQKITAFEESYNKTKKELDDARALNTKMLLSNGVPPTLESSLGAEQETDEPENFEELVTPVIEKANTNYLNSFKENKE